jgi:hypothetical protein
MSCQERPSADFTPLFVCMYAIAAPVPLRDGRAPPQPHRPELRMQGETGGPINTGARVIGDL